LSSEIDKYHGLAGALVGKRVFTEAERAEIDRNYARGSARARRAMVASFLLQGFSAERMARLLGVSVEEVTQHYEEAVNEIQAELESVPEGPMLMSQYVVEGYARYQQFVLSTVIRACKRLAKSGNFKEVPGLLRAGLDTMNAMSTKMERYGMLPVVLEPKGQRGGLRLPGGNQKHPTTESFDEAIDRIARASGVDMAVLEKQAIDEAVQ
jgi:hypothetical protein